MSLAAYAPLPPSFPALNEKQAALHTSPALVSPFLSGCPLILAVGHNQWAYLTHERKGKVISHSDGKAVGLTHPTVILMSVCVESRRVLTNLG